MSVELLRRAASLMRERAEAATDPIGPELWFGGSFLIDAGIPIAEAYHIASWHPTVAVAVADWLDTAGADLWAHGPLHACENGCQVCDDELWQPHVRRALAVARVYLGESS